MDAYKRGMILESKVREREENMREQERKWGAAKGSSLAALCSSVRAMGVEFEWSDPPLSCVL